MNEALRVYTARQLNRLGFPRFPAQGELVHHKEWFHFTVRIPRVPDSNKLIFESDAKDRRKPSDRLIFDVERVARWNRKVFNWMRGRGKTAHEDLLRAIQENENLKREQQVAADAYRAELVEILKGAGPPLELIMVGARVVGVRAVVELKGSAEEVANKLIRLR